MASEKQNTIDKCGWGHGKKDVLANCWWKCESVWLLPKTV
jgi:hypothetical protein